MLLISGKNSGESDKRALFIFSPFFFCLRRLNNICDFLPSCRSLHSPPASRQMICTWRAELQATSLWMMKMVETMVQAPDLETMVRKTPGSVFKPLCFL